MKNTGIDRATQARISAALEKQGSRTSLTEGMDSNPRSTPQKYPFNVRKLKGITLGWRGKEKTLDVMVLAAGMNDAGYDFARGTNIPDTIRAYMGSERTFHYTGPLGGKHTLKVTKASGNNYRLTVD